MKLNYLIVITLLSCICACAIAKEDIAKNDSQPEIKWKSDVDKKTGLSMQYFTQKVKDDQGEKRVKVEYIIEGQANTSLNKIKQVMFDAKLHYLFTGDEQSKIIKDTKGEELLYYYTAKSWPMPALDTVAQLIYEFDEINKVYQFKVIATPDKIEKTDARRINQYEVLYEFTQVTKGEFKLIMQAKIVPPFKVPKWIMNSAFPGAGYDLMIELIKLLEK